MGVGLCDLLGVGGGDAECQSGSRDGRAQGEPPHCELLEIGMARSGAKTGP